MHPILTLSSFAFLFGPSCRALSAPRSIDRNTLFDIISGVLGEKPVEEVLGPTINAARRPRMPGVFGDWQSWSELVMLRNRSLLFCALPKSGSTAWKQLLMRVSGSPHWKTNDSTLIHNPNMSGLDLLGVKPGMHTRYVESHNESDIAYMVRSPKLRKVVLVRDPVTRVLSSYLDRCVDNEEWSRCLSDDPISFADTINLYSQHVQKNCEIADVHFKPQAQMCGLKHIKYDLVGHYEHFASESQDILKKVGLWEEFGRSGWGENGASEFGAVIQETSNHKKDHRTESLVCQHYSPKSLEQVHSLYKADFDLFQYDVSVWEKRCKSSWESWKHSEADRPVLPKFSLLGTFTRKNRSHKRGALKERCRTSH